MEPDEVFDSTELNKALASSVRDIISGNEETRKAVAKQVVQVLSDKIEQSDITTLLFSSENFNINETPSYELDGELSAYIHTPGSFAPMTQPRNREFTLPQEMISCHIMLPLLQLQSGRYGTIADQLANAERALLGQINKIALDTVIAAVPSTTALGNYASGALTTTTLNAAINYIEDQTGGGRVITGRRNKLSPILDFNTQTTTLDIFPESVKEDIVKRGVFGQYRGLPIAGFKQYKTPDGKATLAEDSILVLGQDIGRIGFWGAMQNVDDVEIGTLNWHIHAWVLVGAGVFFPERIYRLVV